MFPQLNSNCQTTIEQTKLMFTKNQNEQLNGMLLNNNNNPNVTPNLNCKFIILVSLR